MSTSSPPPGAGARPPVARAQIARAEGRRGPGRPPRLNRELIVATAAEIAPEALTLQAVADRLGVDRKAINYHIPGRDELLALVAERTLVAELGQLVLPPGDWPQAIRVFAAGLRAALLHRSALSLYVTTLPSAGVLRPADQLLHALLDAGFDDAAASRALTLICAAVFEDARAELLAERFGEHPTLTASRRVLAELPDEALPAIRRVFAESHSFGPDSLGFYLETIISGLTRWLEQHRQD
ncbi:TetR/AcrR family transcriptional regulator C-terminal domain-containing protein [Frankia sp. R82]|uniref:TetR/AcrR family transcriptional regulator C-terminal domain-containing protein n=1 Tax=Frankia sp. R82 TaxID=2950553 RepID=UPI0020434F34|nr:TetR/AcrR family transcriptional regulator C-terminal domain-containing protein [Frankia sp. R82]MCM3885588.1 TetR/AcrR family transcriptional regulator C-terminal domain-containing protein [Frankia sp. R82]